MCLDFTSRTERSYLCRSRNPTTEETAARTRREEILRRRGRTPDESHLAERHADETGAPAGSVPLAVVPSPETIETQAPTASADNEPERVHDVGSDEPDILPNGEAAEAPTATSEQGLGENPGLGPRTEGTAETSDPAQPTFASTSLAVGTGKSGAVEQERVVKQGRAVPDRAPGPGIQLHALGQALGHSSAAITNVLAKLVPGTVRTPDQSQPRRLPPAPVS